MTAQTKETAIMGTEGEAFLKRPRRLGVFSLAFMVVAASAPLTVIAGGSTTAFSVTHATGVPAGYAVLALALVIFSVGYTAMSRKVTNAGAFYAYISQGISRPVGVGASVLALVAYNCMQVGIYGMLGFQVSSFLAGTFGINIPWWIPVFICIAMVGVMGVNRVDISAKVLGILVLAEFLVVIVYDYVALSNPAEGLTLEPLNPASLLVPGAGAVLAFGIAAFMGFESAAIYSEETKNPKKTIPRATFLAVIVIGVFYAFSSWALAMSVGTNKITSAGGIAVEEAGPPLFFDFVSGHLGVIWVDLMSVLFITSLFAALVSFHNAVARYFFSLGREGVLPPYLANVREKYGTPWAGSITQTVIAIIVVAGFAIAGQGSEYGEAFPVVTLFTWMTNTGAFGLVGLMALVSVAVFGFFRNHKDDASIWVRIVAPITAFILLGFVFIMVATNFSVLLDQEKANALTYLLPMIVIGPGAAGTVWALLLRKYRPEIYQRIGLGSIKTTEESTTNAQRSAK